MRCVKHFSYYNDLYDLHTIQECLRIKASFAKDNPPLNKIKASEKEKYHAKLIVYDLFLCYTKGDRYQGKKDTIQKWIEDDKLRDEKLESAKLCKTYYCDDCATPLTEESKNLHNLDVDKLRVLYILRCPKCSKGKGYFDDGERFVHKNLCPKCGSESERKYKKIPNVVKTVYSCPNCDYKNTETWDFNKEDKDYKKKEKLKALMLEKYRAEFCLPEEEEEKYIEEKTKFKHLMDTIQEEDKKQKDPAYKKARKIKTLTITKLKKLLKKALENNKYGSLNFGKPDMGRFITIEFNCQEINSKRKEYDSSNDLKKLIKKTLERTNWRLMSDGINYRLGILTGRLKAFENEDDLAKLFMT